MQTSRILRPINLDSFADSALEQWLRHLFDYAIAQYAEHKKARDRSLQRGEGWRAFRSFFAPCLEPPLGHAFMLLRFYREALSDTSLGNCLHRAFIPLTNEAEHTRGIIGPRTLVYFLLACGADPMRFPDLGTVLRLNPYGSVSLDALPVIIPGSHYFKARHSNLNDPPVLDLSSKFTLIRWCAWLDAVFHLRVHRIYHEAPESCFDPDREIRYLAALGQGQRFFGYMDARAQFAWTQDFTLALVQYATTPKWDVFCKAVGDSSPRTWPTRRSTAL